MIAEPPPKKSLPWACILVLVAFLGLATLYNLSIPSYESPDELQHVAFIVWLADEASLPVVDPKELGPFEQEGTQPPLYYGIAATVMAGLPHRTADNLATLNPHASVGNPLNPSNKNRVLHNVEQERWPYEAGTLSLHLVRMLSTLMALGTLCAIYRLGRIAFPKRPGVALGMMGLVAFMPQFLFLSASVNNDNLVILIASWVLVVLAARIRTPELPGWGTLGVLGILLGFAVLAKLSGLLLWPLAAGTLLWLAWRAKNMRWLAVALLVVFGFALVLCGWWLVRNLYLYGDLSGTSIHIEVMGGQRSRLPSRLGGILAEFRGFRYSFWALFGWFNIMAPEPFYWILDSLTVLGLVGFGAFVLRSLRKQPTWTREIILMLAIWIAFVIAGLLRWTILTSASQGRLVYPALAAIALVLVVGWAECLPRRLRRPVGIAALIGWGICAALCPVLIIKPAYALPERVTSLEEIEGPPADLQVWYEGCCELVGYASPNQPVYPGDWLPLTLVWRVLEPMDENYELFVHAQTADGQLVGQLDTYHGGGMYPTSQWKTGEIIVDTAYVPIRWRDQGPALVRFIVGLHAPPTYERVPAYSGDGEALDTVVAGEAALIPFEWPEPQKNPPVDAVFGQEIRLTDVQFSETNLEPGAVATITIQWEALSRITEEYTGFVHLLAPGGNDVAQDDHPPLNGMFPTRLWFPGTVISDPYRIELPSNLEPGTYELWAGWYQPETGDRLPAVSEETGERWKDDLVYLGSLVIGTGEG